MEQHRCAVNEVHDPPRTWAISKRQFWVLWSIANLSGAAVGGLEWHRLGPATAAFSLDLSVGLKTGVAINIYSHVHISIVTCTLQLSAVIASAMAEGTQEQ